MAVFWGKVKSLPRGVSNKFVTFSKLISNLFESNIFWHLKKKINPITLTFIKWNATISKSSLDVCYQHILYFRASPNRGTHNFPFKVLIFSFAQSCNE